MADRVLAHKKIEPIWNTVVTRYIPDEKGEMRAIDLRNVITHKERESAGGVCLCCHWPRPERETVWRQAGDGQ